MITVQKCYTCKIARITVTIVIQSCLQVGQLVTGFCGQLRSANITAGLVVQVTPLALVCLGIIPCLQVVKNLVFLAKVLLHMKETDPSLSWLISKMVHIATYEAGHYPKQSLKVNSWLNYSFLLHTTLAFWCVQMDCCCRC